MNIKKQLDDLIIKNQVGFEIASSESERQQLVRLFNQLDDITKGQVKLIGTRTHPSDRGVDLNREPAILIAWIFENKSTQI